MKPDLTIKQTCKTCNKELHGREQFMYELYIDFCHVLEERGLLHIEMDNDYLQGFVETYWDQFSKDLEVSDRGNLKLEPQKLSDDERWSIYLFARIENRTIGFECTNCIIAKTPHP